MFAVEVRDHVMVAHSLPSPVFGPAQGLHGATFVVDAAFFTEGLDENGLVVDIGLATEALREALDPLRYRNLDEVEGVRGRITTTEFLCRYIFDKLADVVRAGRLGDAGRVRKLKVQLHESHIARAWYEGAIAERPA
jgi:6-pyruvoyl-tetrahydropterin synthase